MKATSELKKIQEMKYIHGTVAHLKCQVKSHVPCPVTLTSIQTDLKMRFCWPGYFSSLSEQEQFLLNKSSSYFLKTKHIFRNIWAEPWAGSNPG